MDSFRSPWKSASASSLTTTLCIAMLPCLAILLYSCGAPASSPQTSPLKEAAHAVKPEGQIAAASAPEATPELLALGKEVFGKQCTACHGLDGKGKGEAAFLLNPKPRNLTARSYRLVSNAEGIVQVEDIHRTLTRGMPGSAMPSWEILSDKERWAVAHYVKSLQPAVKKQPVRLDPGPEPTADASAVQRGHAVFQKACAACHGPTGRGDGPQEQFDTDGYPVKPRDLTTGIFKGGRDSTQLYYRVAAGLPGSPMPSHLNTLKKEEIWDVIHYVQSLSDPVLDERNQQKMKSIDAGRVSATDLEDPSSAAWDKIALVPLAAMPLWWRDNRPETMDVRAAHDGTHLFFQLSWNDPTANDQQLASHAFRDGAAVQLTALADPPFLAMGQKGVEDVRIWHWKADKQADEKGRRDVDFVNPNMYVATYPTEKKDAGAAEKLGVDFAGTDSAKATRTPDLDQRYVTGTAAGNVVSNHTGATESLTARGFGTLGARPGADQGVTARGEWKDGRYVVVFKRPLKQEGEKAVTIEAGKTYHIAAACWDGTAGDRGGQKSVTIWHRLKLVN
jgi:mono/diheme cytochrome c family protein